MFWGLAAGFQRATKLQGFLVGRCYYLYWKSFFKYRSLLTEHGYKYNFAFHSLWTEPWSAVPPTLLSELNSHPACRAQQAPSCQGKHLKLFYSFFQLQCCPPEAAAGFLEPSSHIPPFASLPWNSWKGVWHFLAVFERFISEMNSRLHKAVLSMHQLHDRWCMNCVGPVAETGNHVKFTFLLIIQTLIFQH